MLAINTLNVSDVLAPTILVNNGFFDGSKQQLMQNSYIAQQP